MTTTDGAATGRARTKSRFLLLLLVVLFFAPLGIAFLLYYGGVWRPAENTQNGDLIHPARPLPEVVLTGADGKTLPERVLHTRWSLLYVGDGRCDERCRAALADMQRARELLGKDSTRVQSVFLAIANCCATEFLAATYPRLIVGRADSPSAAEVLAPFPAYDSIPVAQAGRIYIVDPLGNLMMSYAADASGVGMYNDLKKLLKLSHIG